MKSCDLTGDMVSGEAIYEVVDKNELEDGTIKEETMHWKVEAANGDVHLYISFPGKKGGVKADVSRWELLD